MQDYSQEINHLLATSEAYDNYLFERIYQYLSAKQFENNPAFNTREELKENIVIEKDGNGIRVGNFYMFPNEDLKILFNKYKLFSELKNTLGDEPTLQDYNRFASRILQYSRILLTPVSNNDLTFFQSIKQGIDTLSNGTHSQLLVNAAQSLRTKIDNNRENHLDEGNYRSNNYGW